MAVFVHKHAGMDMWELESKFGVTEQQLDAMAEQYESGEWPDGHTVVLGRPRVSDDELVSVTIKLPKTQLEIIDGEAKRLGKNRSAQMRDLLKFAMTL